jgi:anti-sigma factor RsiW
MKRDHDHDRPPAELLLAAHADGALDGADEAAVAEHLAADPAAREQLAALREVLAEARAAAPAPAAEPDWDAMARDIGRACDAAARPGLWATLRALLRPRPATFALAAAAAALLLYLAAPAVRSTAPAPPPAPETALPHGAIPDADELDQPGYAGPVGADLYPEPDYDAWIEDFTEDQLDALDAYLLAQLG